MSKDVFENEKYILTQFYGGIEEGVCIQLTSKSRKEYIQLNKVEVIELMIQLLKWIKEGLEGG